MSTQFSFLARLTATLGWLQLVTVTVCTNPFGSKGFSLSRSGYNLRLGLHKFDLAGCILRVAGDKVRNYFVLAFVDHFPYLGSWIYMFPARNHPDCQSK